MSNQVTVNSILERDALKGIKAIDKSATNEQMIWLTVGSLWNEAIESVRTEGKPLDSKGYDRKTLNAYGLKLFAGTRLVKLDKDNKPKLDSVILGDAKFMLLNWAEISAYLMDAGKTHLRNPSRIIRAYRDSLKAPKSEKQAEIDKANAVLKAVTALTEKEKESGIDRSAKSLLAQAYALLKIRFENDGDILDAAVTKLTETAKADKAAA